jgi:hypothetical protein
MTMVTHNAEGIEAKIKLNQRLFDGIEKHLPTVSMTQLKLTIIAQRCYMIDISSFKCSLFS